MDTSTFVSGALPDARTPEQQARDWTQGEVLAAAAQVQWTEKSQSSWRRFPIFNQDGSGSCVMQTQCKELGIMRYMNDGDYVHFSVADGYQRRANAPQGGMGSDDARRIARDGITLEALVPSQNMSDAQLDAVTVKPYEREIGAVLAAPNSLTLPIGDIESIASTIQATGKGVMVWYYFLYPEWTDKPTMQSASLGKDDQGVVRHSITAVDFTLQGGEKCLVIEDSWGPQFGLGGQRVITESFHKARNFFAGYLVNFKFQQTAVHPIHTFSVDMQLGDQSTEVAVLQDCLKADGEFPQNADSTGYFGPVTQTAVQAFQVKHGVVAVGAPGYGRVGPKTRAALNLIFSN